MFLLLCTRGKIDFFIYDFEIANFYGFVISKNSFMYSNTFESYDFNDVTDH